MPTNPPAKQANAPAAAPLKPPSSKNSMTPAPAPADLGNPVTMPSNRVRGLVDRNGENLNADDLFVDEGASRSVAKTRIYEEVLIGGTRTTTLRLRFPEGQVVDREVAIAARDEAKAQGKPEGTPATGADPGEVPEPEPSAPTPDGQ